MSAATLIHYLRYPLHAAPLLVMGFVMLIACVTLGLWLSPIHTLMGVPLLLLAVSWFIKYSFFLLDYVIDGRPAPPVLSAEMVNPVQQRPLGLLLVLIGCYVATMALEPAIGQLGVRALRIGGLLLVPAMVAAMSAGRFWDMLNPVLVFGTIARIPTAYATLLLLLAILWSVPFVVFTLVDALPVLTVLVELALAFYLWLAMCACIGGIIYEQRETLGFEPAYSPERTAARARRDIERARDKIWDPIFAQVRGGALANAGAAVRKLIDSSPQPLEEFRWLYARAALWPDQRLANYLAQLCLPRLLAARANGEALDVVRARLRASDEFRPDSGTQVISIAKLARDAGDRATARLLLSDFDARFPNDPAASVAAIVRAELTR